MEYKEEIKPKEIKTLVRIIPINFKKDYFGCRTVRVSVEDNERKKIMSRTE